MQAEGSGVQGRLPPHSTFSLGFMRSCLRNSQTLRWLSKCRQLPPKLMALIWSPESHSGRLRANSSVCPLPSACAHIHKNIDRGQTDKVAKSVSGAREMGQLVKCSLWNMRM